MYKLEPVFSTCDVTAQEMLADYIWRSLTSTGYNEGSGSYIQWVEITVYYITAKIYKQLFFIMFINFYF